MGDYFLVGRRCAVGLIKCPLSLSTLVLTEGSTEAADTGAVSGGHNNVVRLAADQVVQRAVGAGAAAGDRRFAAGDRRSAAGGFHGIAHCIRTGGPVHLSGTSVTHQLAVHISGRTWLCRGKQMTHQPLLMKS